MRPKVLFVGSFLESAKDGSVGGQMFACRSLIQSSLQHDVDFILIDSTAESVPAPGFLKRLWLASRRFTYFLFLFATKKPDSVLIFSSAGSSFIEKGMMVLISRTFSSNVILAPRSGLLIDNINRGTFFKIFARVVLRASSHIICQGEFWKNYFIALMGVDYNEKMKVIPNWIDVNRYLTDGPQPTSVITFVYIGWLETYKGVRDLLEAARIIKENKFGFELHVYGDGRQKQWLLDYIRLNFGNEVIYKGWITGSDKASALRSADVIVLPSHREGFPNALLEAMAYQKPVIASDIGVVPEIISHRRNGLLFKCGSARDLADKMAMMIQEVDSRRSMAIQARKTVEERYSVEQAATTFKSLLRLGN